MRLRFPGGTGWASPGARVTGGLSPPMQGLHHLKEVETGGGGSFPEPLDELGVDHHGPGHHQRLVSCLGLVSPSRSPGAVSGILFTSQRRLCPGTGSYALACQHPCVCQDDCKVSSNPLMVSLSNHRRIERASFDKLRMRRHQWAALLCNRPAASVCPGPGSQKMSDNRHLIGHLSSAVSCRESSAWTRSSASDKEAASIACSRTWTGSSPAASQASAASSNRSRCRPGPRRASKDRRVNSRTKSGRMYTCQGGMSSRSCSICGLDAGPPGYLPED